MATRLHGDDARRAILEYWRERDQRDSLQSRIAGFMAQVDEIKRGPRTFDAAMRLGAAQKQIAALAPAATMAASRAGRLADQLGIDEKPPARRTGPVKLGPVSRVAPRPAKRTMPVLGFMNRAIGLGR